MLRSCTSSRVLARLVLGVVTGVSVLWAAGPAAARLVADGEPTAPGETTVTFTVERGCDGAPTTALSVRLPSGAADVLPQVPPGWTVRSAGDELEWLNGSAPDGVPASFVVSLRVPGKIGDIVYLPTVQTCGSVRKEWTATVADAQAPGAAPRIELEISYLPLVPVSPTTTIAPESTTTTTTPAAVAGGDGGAPEESGPSGVPLLAGVLIVGLAAAVLLARRMTGGDG